MTVDMEKQGRLDEDDSRGTSMLDGRAPATPPLALRRSLSRHTYRGGEKTLANKPDDVDAEVWLEASSVTGIKERKVSPPPFTARGTDPARDRTPLRHEDTRADHALFFCPSRSQQLTCMSLSLPGAGVEKSQEPHADPLSLDAPPQGGRRLLSC